MFNFKPEEGSEPFDLKGVVRGPDGAPYVIDGPRTRSSASISSGSGQRSSFARGAKSGRTKVATPRFLGVGGRDLLILDAKNDLWRWPASNDAGKGRLNKVNVNGATQWGDDIVAMGTYLRDLDRGLVNLYVVDPSAPVMPGRDVVDQLALLFADGAEHHRPAQ